MPVAVRGDRVDTTPDPPEDPQEPNGPAAFLFMR
jgi:hypothetical protein